MDGYSEMVIIRHNTLLSGLALLITRHETLLATHSPARFTETFIVIGCKQTTRTKKSHSHTSRTIRIIRLHTPDNPAAHSPIQFTETFIRIGRKQTTRT